ncbi:MAG: MMPL family transporter [Polyangiaceae bacterium]
MTPRHHVPPPPGSSPASRRSNALFARLADVQLRHPWAMLLVALLLVVGSLTLASRLEIRPGFEALLPEDRPSVKELERVKQHTSGISSVFVVLEGQDTQKLREAANEVAAEVSKLGRPWVGSAESGVHEALGYLKPRAGLFVPEDKLQSIHDRIEARYLWEVGKATGANLELDDEEPPPIDVESLKKELGIGDQELERYPDGYFQSADGKTLVVAIRSGVMGTDYTQGNEAIRRIKEIVERVDPKRFDPSVKVGFAGDLVTANAEYRAINADLMDVGILGGVLIISVVFLYYLRMRTLLTMLLTISIGVSLCFAYAALSVGYLTMATGFLFSIIAGNGINPGIIYMARYLEARRRYMDAPGAIQIAHRDTWLPTLTASGAASAAYASLVVTEFRGFHDFGVIGGVGMLLCWLCTYTFLPSILIIAERLAPLDQDKGRLFGLLKPSRKSSSFGSPFARAVARAPRALTLAGLGVTLAAILATVVWVKNDPMEYDLQNLRTDMSKRAEEERISRLASIITGHVNADGMAILVDRPEQVPELIQALEARRDAAPEGEKPFKAVHALQDFVPADQAKKIPLLLDIKNLVKKAEARGFLDDKQVAEVRGYLPPDDLKPFGIEDLPAGIARTFTEADGTRGRIVFISPIDMDAVHDAHYLFRWADAYRRTELPDGSVVLGSGRAVIYADIWEAVIDDVPIVVAVSLLSTLLVVVLAFRRGFASIAVLVALLAGVAWMTGMLGLIGEKLNFLNFVALPITFGIGVDYAVNVMQRYRREGSGGVVRAVRETGGAVVLCSLTTTLGYLALVRSMNYAVRSLGIAAVLGEVACLVTAVVLLPAALAWRDGVALTQARDSETRR